MKIWALQKQYYSKEIKKIMSIFNFQSTDIKNRMERFK